MWNRLRGTGLGLFLIGCATLFIWGEHLEFALDLIAGTKKLLVGIAWHDLIPWTMIVGGFGMMILGWIPEKWKDSWLPTRYILASAALDHIALDSHWSKTIGRAQAVNWTLDQFQAMAELGKVRTKGVRRVGQFTFGLQEIPPSHWTVANLVVPGHWYAVSFSAGSSIHGHHLSTQAISLFSGTTDENGAPVNTPLPVAFYVDVQMKRRDVYALWPKDRWWHRAMRAIASQR